MTEETWQAARLIPTSGITGAEEQERRGTSALLAVMSAVHEFGRAVTQQLGAPAGNLETYIEVPFKLGERKVFPDGLIRVTRGKKQWVALVEVKTGANQLRAEQVESYLDVARAEGFDMVLTISNQMEPQPGVHPVKVDGRRLRKVALRHLSWTQFLTEAVMQKVHRGVADRDQAWILGELIHYLQHPRSGAMEFDDMGESWVPLRNAVMAGTMRPNDKGASEVSSRWDQLIRYACLRLGRELGVAVEPVLRGKDRSDPATRTQTLLSRLAERGVLEGQLHIPDTAGEITVIADLRAQLVSVAIEVDAPREGRSQTRLNWLLRQLKQAPANLRIDTYAMHNRSVADSELLSTVRENPGVLIGDPRRELRTFRVVMSAPMGAKRGSGRGSFIGSVLGVLDNFYETTVQTLKPWAASPPRISVGPSMAAEEVTDQVAVEKARLTGVSTPPSRDGANVAGVEAPIAECSMSTVIPSAEQAILTTADDVRDEGGTRTT